MWAKKKSGYNILNQFILPVHLCLIELVYFAVLCEGQIITTRIFLNVVFFNTKKVVGISILTLINTTLHHQGRDTSLDTSLFGIERK